VRDDPRRLRFAIDARDGAARTGRLLTSHGAVDTPAFIPLATRGAVRTLSASDLDELGYGLVLANTFHLFLAPGAERIAELGGLHRFMGWERAIVTDSGGFQVFSLAHGNVADEIKGRRGSAGSSGGVVEISERGVAFRSYVDGSRRFLGPEESMETQAALGSDLALTFDECTPYHADRDYTARSTERTQRWLDRCLAWHDEHGPADQAVFGIVQGGVHEDLRRISAEHTAAAEVDGLAIGGTLGRDKEEMGHVVELSAGMLPPEAPKHLLGIGEPDDLVHGIGMFVSDLRPPHSRVPSLPLPRRGADRGAPADDPQPGLPRAAGRRRAGRDPRRHLRRLPGGDPRRLGAVGGAYCVFSRMKSSIFWICSLSSCLISSPGSVF
jgi:queuine tRNA-ribosyltransferase